VAAAFEAERNGLAMKKPQHRYPTLPPEVIAYLYRVPETDPADLRRAQWLWSRRLVWSNPWDDRALVGVVAIFASLLLGPLFGPSLGQWLTTWSILCTWAFVWQSNRYERRWNHWYTTIAEPSTVSQVNTLSAKADL
jgi:hypothetical protein